MHLCALSCNDRKKAQDPNKLHFLLMAVKRTFNMIFRSCHTMLPLLGAG